MLAGDVSHLAVSHGDGCHALRTRPKHSGVIGDHDFIIRIGDLVMAHRCLIHASLGETDKILPSDRDSGPLIMITRAGNFTYSGIGNKP